MAGPGQLAQAHCHALFHLAQPRLHIATGLSHHTLMTTIGQGEQPQPCIHAEQKLIASSFTDEDERKVTIRRPSVLCAGTVGRFQAGRGCHSVTCCMVFRELQQEGRGSP